MTELCKDAEMYLGYNKQRSRNLYVLPMYFFLLAMEVLFFTRNVSILHGTGILFQIIISKITKITKSNAKSDVACSINGQIMHNLHLRQHQRSMNERDSLYGQGVAVGPR